METTNPRIRSLLRQAEKVAASGKRSAAEKLYRQVIEEAPETATAWTGLAGVLRDPALQETALQKALEIDPKHAEANRQLAILHGEIPAEVVMEVESSDQNQSLKNEPSGEISTVTALSDPDVAERVDEANSEALESLASETVADDQVQEEDEHHLEYVEDVLYCANHPRRETHLRCNRCGKPICTSCAKPTPVGYRCPECIREHEEIYYTATILDYIVAVAIALPLSLVGGYIAKFIGIFVIFLAAAAGSLIGRVVFRAVGRRRGRWLPQLVSGVIVIGGLFAAADYLLSLLFGNIGISFRLLWVGIYIVMASGAAYYQMK